MDAGGHLFRQILPRGYGFVHDLQNENAQRRGHRHAQTHGQI